MRKARQPRLGLAGLIAIIMTIMAVSQVTALAGDQVVAVLWRGTPSEKVAVQGLIDALAAGEASGNPAVPVKVVNAQGDLEQARSLLTSAIGEQPAALVTVGTPVTRLARDLAKDFPIIFMNVSDPVGEQLIVDWASSGNHLVGVSNESSVRQRVDYAQTVLPRATAWVVVGSTDPAATRQIEEIKALSVEFSLELQVVQADSVDGLATGVKEAAAEADLVLLVDDALVEQAVSEILAVSGEVPIFGATDQEVEAGAVAGLCLDYAQAGKEAAALLTEILAGAEPFDLPTFTGLRPRLVVNLPASINRGQRIPVEVLALADRVFE